MASADQVLDFWFGTLDAFGRADPERARRWFRASQSFDDAIRDQFASLVERALGGSLEGWSASARGTLALILLLDQFPRNLFRGQPRAFAGDARAQALSRRMVERGEDRALPFDQRLFAYLPLEHAESRLCQALHLGLLEQLREELPASRRGELESALRHAREHAEIIARFGRFPHRNAVLGRQDSAAERAYLEAGARRFGQ